MSSLNANLTVLAGKLHYVGKLVDEVLKKVIEKKDPVTRLVTQVSDRSKRYASSERGARQQSAESAQALLATLAHAAEVDVVTLLANANLQTSEAAVSRSLGQAQACADTLISGNWQLFDVVRELADFRRDAALLIMNRLIEIIISDEHVVPLKPRLEELTRDAMQLLVVSAPAPTPPIPPITGPRLPAGGSDPAPVALPPAPPATWSEVVDEKQQLQLSGTDAVTALDELKTLVTSERDLELTLSWRVQRKGTKL